MFFAEGRRPRPLVWKPLVQVMAYLHEEVVVVAESEVSWVLRRREQSFAVVT